MLKKTFAFLLFLLLLVLPGTVLAEPAPKGEATSSLITQMVEQNLSDPNALLAAKFFQPSQSPGFFLDFLEGISGQFAVWSNQVFSGYLPGTIAGLTSVVKSFFLNANLAQISANSGNHSDLSFLLKEFVNIIYGIAFDLLFVLFVLAIWHYWTKASWQGNISAMSAVGRLICTMGIILAWPTIYSYEIELSNQMISAIFVNSTDQLHLLDMVMANMFKFDLNIGAGNVITQIIPAANLAALGIVSLGGLLSTLAWLFLFILAMVFIYELIYLIVLKAVQMALLAAQFIFAPVFLIFFAVPSTEKIASGYIRTFAETSLWSFIWIGLLKILIILIYADFNPWGKIITAIGVLQLMMRVPEFLGRFKISAASDFVNPAFFSTGLREKATECASQAKIYKDQLWSAMTGAFGNAATNPMPASAGIGIGVTMPVDFSFDGAGGKVGPLPNSHRQKIEPVPAAPVNNFPIDISPPARSKPPANIEMRTSAHTVMPGHFGALNIPRRKNLSSKENIFARHNKTAIHRRSNIFDLPTGKESASGVPEGALAFLSKNIATSSPSISDLALAGIAYPKFDPSPQSLNLAMPRASIANSRLLTTRYAVGRLAFGSQLLQMNRQQFFLPGFALKEQTKPGWRNTDIYQRTESANAPAIKNDRSPFSNRHHYVPAKTPAATNHSFNQYRSSQYQSTLYYPAPIHPGSQRPYYRNSLYEAFPTNTNAVASFSPGINCPIAQYFHSYYS